MKFYKDSNGIWHLGDRILPPLSISLLNENNGYVSFISQDGSDSSILISDIQRSDGTYYGTLDTLLSECSDFFVKPSVNGGITIKPSNYLYVGKNGSDNNNGAAESPFLTIGAAISAASSGTTIFIFPGNYAESLTLKEGVNLTSPVKFGVTITGNHSANFTGTVVLENITLYSTTGNTLSVSGSTAVNLQLIGCSVNSNTGDAINWQNTSSSSKLYIEDSTVNVTASSSSARGFYSDSTSAGSIIANRASFKIDNAENICLALNGAVGFTHTSDIVYGGITVANTSSYVGQLVALTAYGIPCLYTSSTGTSILFACTLSDSITPIQGAGVFMFSALTYTSTGVGGLATLNGGAGAIALPISAIAVRSASLKATAQDGLIEYNGSHLYFTIGSTRYTVAMTTDKELIFRDMWNEAAGSFGTYNSSTGYYELNGLTNITYQQALDIYMASAYKDVNMDYTGYYFHMTGHTFRTNLPSRVWYSRLQNVTLSTYLNDSLEVLNLQQLNPFSYVKTSVTSLSLYYNNSLVTVLGILDISGLSSYSGIFNMPLLQNISLYGVKYSMPTGFATAQNITYDSLNYLVTNAANTGAITITVHASVYAKLTDTTNTYPTWVALNTTASGKNITFASA